jgi:hypothetical protein
MAPVLTFCAGCNVEGQGRFCFEFKTADGLPYHMTLTVGAMKALAPLMLNILQDAERGTNRGQVAVLTSARAGYLEDGTPLLGLGLNGIEVAVALQAPDAIERIALCISEFQSTAKGSMARH